MEVDMVCPCEGKLRVDMEHERTFKAYCQLCSKCIDQCGRRVLTIHFKEHKKAMAHASTICSLFKCEDESKNKNNEDQPSASNFSELTVPMPFTEPHLSHEVGGMQLLITSFATNENVMEAEFLWTLISVKALFP